MSTEVWVKHIIQEASLSQCKECGRNYIKEIDVEVHSLKSEFLKEYNKSEIIEEYEKEI